MRARHLAVALVLSFGFAGCESDKSPVMPDVTGKKLDVAKAAINDAGFEDEVKVEGGGLFGVIKESNWEVCDQSPSAGAALTDAPRLTVDRSCDDDAEPSETPSETTEPSESPSETTEPSESPSQATEPSETPSETSEPDVPESSEADAGQVLTSDNNDELAALLEVSDYCDETIGSFAKKYAGKTIQFDGSVVDVAPHGSYSTRFDYLLGPGNMGPNTTVGPAFKFADVNYYDFNLTGKHTPDSIDVGGKFRFIAEVDRYSANSCLLFLTPVETQTR